MTDTILLPLAHSPLSHDTVISSKTRLRLGTSLVTSLVMHSMTGHASATLPPGYEFQNAYLGTQEQAQSPCQNRRTITRSYSYQLPQENATQFQLRDYGYTAGQREIQINNQKFVFFDLF